MQSLVKLSAKFVETSIDDEVIIMRIDSGDFFSLSGTAATIWRLIDGRRDRQALLDALSADYDVAGEEIAADVDELLQHLREAGVVDYA